MTHDNWLNESFMKEKYREVVRIATALRDERIDFLEGVRALFSLQWDVSRQSHDPDFRIFVAIYSETDHMPEGGLRRRYAPSLLEQSGRELEQLKKSVDKDVKQACNKLIERFSAIA